MPELPVEASKFAGMSEEQQRTFPRRTVIGEHLSEAELEAMPQMISTDSHVMEPEELWRELPKHMQDMLPKVPFRNSPPGATDPHLRLADQNTDGELFKCVSALGVNFELRCLTAVQGVHGYAIDDQLNLFDGGLAGT